MHTGIRNLAKETYSFLNRTHLVAIHVFFSVSTVQHNCGTIIMSHFYLCGMFRALHLFSFSQGLIFCRYLSKAMTMALLTLPASSEICMMIKLIFRGKKTCEGLRSQTLVVPNLHNQAFFTFFYVELHSGDDIVVNKSFRLSRRPIRPRSFLLAFSHCFMRNQTPSESRSSKKFKE